MIKCFSNVSLRSRTACLPVICYLESKKHWHDGGSKDLGILLSYMSQICSFATPALSTLESGLKHDRSCKMVGFKNILGTSGILRSLDTLGDNDLN